MTDRLSEITREPTGFVARPTWERWLRRQWRRRIVAHLHPSKQHREAARWIVSPKEISQERMDAAIRRGQELAKKYGWDRVTP